MWDLKSFLMKFEKSGLLESRDLRKVPKFVYNNNKQNLKILFQYKKNIIWSRDGQKIHVFRKIEFFSLSASIFPFKNNGIKFFDPARDSPFYELSDDWLYDKLSGVLLYE